MKKLLILFAVLLLTGIVTNLNSQDGDKSDAIQLSDVIIVRLVETTGSASLDSEIIIYYGNDKFEKIELKNLTMKGYPITNLEKIHIVISRLYGSKYELVNTYTSGGGVNFIFKKK